MQTISSAEKALLEGFGPVTLHLYVGGAEVPAKVVGFSHIAAVSDTTICCGNAIAAAVEMSVDAEPLVRILSTRDGKILSTRNGEILAARLIWAGIEGVDLGVSWDVDGETTHKLFSGTVEKVQVSGGRAKITAQDAMFWAGSGDFSTQSSYQSDCDAGAVLQAIASGMGVGLHSGTASLAAGVTISGGFSSCRGQITLATAAGYVAGILGGNAVINRDGELEVRRFAAADFSAEVYSGGANAENQDYTPTGVTFSRIYTTSTVNGDGTTSEVEETRIYSAGDGSISMENPLADQMAATRALSALASVTSRAGTYDYPMGIQVEPGDVITVRSMDGDRVAAIVSHRMAIDGGVKSTDRAGGAPLSGGSSGPISKRLNALELDLLRIKNLYAENAEITNANIQSLKAGEIDVDALFAKDITATGVFQVRNTAYSLIQSNEGLRLGPDAGEEAPFAYMELTNNHVVIGSRNGIDISADMTLKLFGSYGIELGSNTFPASFYDSFPDFGRTDRRWGTVYCKTVDIDGKPAIARQTKTVTGTTSSAGNLSLGLDMSLYGVLCVTRTGASSICTPYATAGGAWYAHVASNAATPAAVASTSVTLEVDYYAK